MDFDPVRAKAAGRDPGLPQPLADLFPSSLQESELGPIPTGWRVTSAGDLATLNPELRADSTKIVRYLDLTNVKSGRINEIAEFAADAAPSRAQRSIRPGDTIVGTVRPANGSYAMVLESGLTASTGFAVLRPKRQHDAALVYHAATASAQIQALGRMAHGGAYPAVAPNAVANAPFALGSRQLSDEFARLAWPLHLRIAAAALESRTLAALRDTLLPKLISGEIRLKQAELIAAKAL